MYRTTIITRMDIAPETVQAAKIAYAATAGEDTNNHAKLNFRMVLDAAVTNHLPAVAEGLSR